MRCFWSGSLFCAVWVHIDPGRPTRTRDNSTMPSTNRRSQPPLAWSVPQSRFTSPASDRPDGPCPEPVRPEGPRYPAPSGRGNVWMPVFPARWAGLMDHAPLALSNTVTTIQARRAGIPQTRATPWRCGVGPGPKGHHPSAQGNSLGILRATSPCGLKGHAGLPLQDGKTYE